MQKPSYLFKNILVHGIKYSFEYYLTYIARLNP
jgi:hypothetical protein